MNRKYTELDRETACSRRDMGNIQENLATIQTTAGCLGDRVTRLQAVLGQVERQAGVVLGVRGQ